MADVQVPTDLLTDMVDFVEETSKVISGHEKQAAEVQSQAKVTLEAMKKAGLCQPGVADEALLTKLASPTEALKALAKTAALVKAPTMGRPEEPVAQTKTAGARGSSADEKFERAFGL